jgi:hypothetical protein
MDRTTLALMIVAAAILIFSIPAARRSANKDKIRGGSQASLFHLIGVAAYIGVLPSALCGSILVGPFRLGIPLALGFVALSFAALLGYSYFERPARQGLASQEDRGWTEEDARKSGL